MTTEYDYICSLREALARHGYMAVLWHIDDVLHLRPDLTAEQAMEVLQECVDKHHADWGITSETIRTMAEELFPLDNTKA